MEEQRKTHPDPPPLATAPLSLSLITLLCHRVPNVTTAPPDMPTSRQSHAMPLPQPTRTVSCPPETIRCAPSPVYKKAPILGRKDSQHLTLPPRQHLQLPLSLVRACRRRHPRRPPPVPGATEPPPTQCLREVAEKTSLRRQDTSPPVAACSGEPPLAPPPPSALARCVHRAGEEDPPIPIRFIKP
jgi:hypothetical protein